MKIVASSIRDLNENAISQEKNPSRISCVSIDITNLDENRKDRLRGAIKFFSGDRANVRLEIVQDGQVKPCGGIFMTNQILEQFEEIVSKDNIKMK